MPDYRFIDKVSAAANITANAIVVGDDGAKGIKALALGAANLKLFMNAAGTANEYASGMKIGTFTKNTADASGDQAITGVGFKPSKIIFFVMVDSTSEMSIGLDDGTLHYVLSDYYAFTAGDWSYRATASIELLQAAGISSLGVITAIGADGFTITWTKTGAKTGTATIIYMAFR